MTPDDDHLRLLSIFHYIVGGLIGLFGLIFVIHLVIGLIILLSPQTMRDSSGQLPPAAVGWLFTLMGAAAVTVGLAVAGLVIAAGRFLARRSHYTFCFVIACLECLFQPFGTVLGIFTIIVLLRDSVKQRFGVGTVVKAE